MASAESTPVRLLRDARPVAARRARELVTRVPVAVALLLAAALALRLIVALVYQPALMNNADTATYIVMSDGGLFGDPVRTSGYPLFMIALHALSDQMAFTIGVQHLLGIATGLLLYAIGRRAGAPVWAAAIGAAAVWLSLDQIVLEHLILSEALFTFLFVAALYACVRALDEPRPVWGPLDSRHCWILLAGLLLGLSGWMRGVAAPLAPFLVIWALLAIPGERRRRIANAGLAALAVGAALLGYAALNEIKTGHFGLSQSSGWALYSRIAPKADCTQFEPPADTEALCESPPSGYGPDWYGWEQGSPAIQAYGYPPNGNDELAAFARASIRAQPLAYLNSVGVDVLRYFLPDYRTYAYGGPGYDTLDIGRHDPALEREVWGWLSAYYDGIDQRVLDEPVGVLSEIQDWVRVQPLLMLAAMLAAAAGIVFTRGRVRAVLVLLAGAGLLLLLVPSATANYNARYAIPASGPIVVAGAIAVWALLARRRSRSEAAASGAPGEVSARSG